jgi:transcriptional regulator with XRE-family HTH domain
MGGLDLDGLPTGRRIAVLRRRAQLTQAGLAMKLHRSKSWVEKVERGVHVVENLATLRQVADALGVPLTVLREDFDPSRPGGSALAPLGRDPCLACAVEKHRHGCLTIRAIAWSTGSSPTASSPRSPRPARTQ